MVVAAIGSQPKIMPDTKRLELELRTQSEIACQQPEHKVRLLSQCFEQMRNPWHEAAWAMRFLQGQAEAGDITLVKDIDRHHSLVQLMLDERFAKNCHVGLARHLNTGKPIRN